MSKILLVDDEDALRGVMCSQLERSNYTCVECASAEEAVELLRTTPDIDLAVLDIWLGRNSGLALFDSLRDISPDLPVIFISGGGGGVAMETITALADMKGGLSFLYKPFQGKDLVAAVAKALG